MLSQDGSFVPVVLEGKSIDPRPGHTCSTSKEVPVCCLDENGKLQITNDSAYFKEIIFVGSYSWLVRYL